jgi:5-formyltetrahydrofolate cyclo-ligase
MSFDAFPTKYSIRNDIWTTLENEGAATDCHDKIPDFVGKEQAARHLAQSALWRDILDHGQAIMTAPDSVLEPVRTLALQAGIPTYMAVPGLKHEAPFVLLGEEALDVDEPLNEAYPAVSMPIAVEDMATALPAFATIIGGSVAVDEQGNRLGKGKGYFDFELAALNTIGKLEPGTHILSVVHSLQVVRHLPTAPNDAQMTGYATEKGLTLIDREQSREPPRLRPHLLDDESKQIPLVRWLLQNPDQQQER